MGGADKEDRAAGSNRMRHRGRQSSGRVDLDHAVPGPALTRRRSS